MSWRRLRVVLDNLPVESAFVTAIRESMTAEDWQRLDKRSGGAVRFGPWSQTEMLLAEVCDRLGQLAWMQSDGSTPPPDPYPRPGVDLTNVHSINSDAEAYLREVERLHGAQPAPDWRPPSQREAT